MESTLISIITVSFNNFEGLKKTVNNFFDLTYPNRELIIIDGGSTDGTHDYIKTIASQSNQIRIVSEKDNGIYDAMNKGVKLAKGDWIVFMNAGDTFYKDTTLSTISQYLNNATIQAFYGDAEIKYDNFSRIQKAFPSITHWKSTPFVHQSLYCRKNIITEHPFDLKYKICADYEIYLWMLSKTITIHNINQTVSIVSSGGKSDTKRASASLEKMNINNSYSNGKAFYKSVYFFFEYLKGLLSFLIKGIIPKSLDNYLTKRKYGIE